MAALTIETGTYKGERIIRLIGAFNKTGVDAFKDAMEDATRMDTTQIYIDLSRLKTIDSMGLGILIYHFSYLKNNGRDLIIYNPNSTMRELLEISCLDKLISIEVGRS